MKSLIILTEAGEGIGLGHLFRCMSLARAAKERNISVQLIVEFIGEVPTNIQGEFQVFNWKKDLSVLGENTELCVIDSYLATKEVYDEAKLKVDYLAVIDDYDRIKYDSDCIINPSLYGGELNYEKNTVLITGRDTLLLREEFCLSIPKKVISPKIFKLLITLGGTDPFNYLPQLIEQLQGQYELNVLAGNDAYQKQLIAKYGQIQGLNLFGFSSAERVRELMEGCDVGISAGGQTLHEFTVLGVPVIPVCIGDDQLPNLITYKALNLFNQYASYDKNDLLEVVEEGLLSLKPSERRSELSLKAQSLLGLNGANTIVSRLISFFENDINSLLEFNYNSLKVQSIESRNLEESKELLSWRNHSGVREMMNDSKEIKFESHIEFVQKLSYDTGNYYWRVLSGGSGIGVIYLNKVNRHLGIAEIGIYSNLFNTIRGKGTVLMDTLLYIGFSLFGLNCIKLEVKEGNLNAIALYEKFGFQVTEENSGRIYMELTKQWI